MSYVNSIGVNISTPNVATPDKIHSSGDFVPSFGPDPSAPWSLVRDRFDQSMATAEDMMSRLVGGNGYTGYLNDLESIIADFSGLSGSVSYNNVSFGSDITVNVPSVPVAPHIVPISAVLPPIGASPTVVEVSTDLVTFVSPSVPIFVGGLDTNFDSFNAASPVMLAIPSIDLSSLTSVTKPVDISSSVSWFEENHNTDVYTLLFNRLLYDTIGGATGVGGVVEQEIYDRASLRLSIEEAKQQTEIEEYFSNSGFELPTGAFASRLQEHTNNRSMRLLDLNGKIMVEQADLAQKNNQFVLTLAKDLESILRDYSAKKNDRSLDFAKAVAANAVAVYSESIRGYVATLEANKSYVELQVAVLQGIIETNKANVELYSSEAKVYEISINAKAKKNDAVTEIYKAEVSGYVAESSAATEVFKAKIQEKEAINSAITNRYKAKIDGFSTEANIGVEVYKAEITGNTAYNSVLVDGYKAEISGYDSSTRAVSDNQKNVLQSYALKIQDADNELKAAIANIDASIRGYGTEYSLREKVAESMANIAMQAMSSAYGAVNASAGLSYNGSESLSESWGHSESRSDSYGHSESISVSSSISATLSNTLSEEHTYKEK